RAQEQAVNWPRYIAIAKRYRWLMLAIVAIATLLGVMMTRNLVPEYSVASTVWISSDKLNNRSGPIRAGHLVTSNSWPDLVTSFAVLDNVVREVPLSLWTSKADKPLFAT